MTICPSKVLCADIAGNRTADISGALNMFGSLGVFASANVFPLLDRRTGSSSSYFFLATLLDLAGMLCWFRMRSAAFRPPVSGVYASGSGR